MTIIEKSTFTGVDHHTTRPFSRVRMGQQLKKVAQDQAYAYKTLTGVAVPNAPGSDVATNHTHDGTTGAVIPIPVAQEWLGANLARGPNAGGYAPLIFFPFFAPPGVTTWRLYLATRKPDALISIVRCKVMKSSLETTAGGSAFRRIRDTSDEAGSAYVIYSDITVTANSLNCLRLECVEGSTAPVDVDVISYSFVPYFGDPVIYSAPDPLDENTSIVGPTATDHLGAYPFASFDDAMFDDDAAIPSYVVNSLNKNNVYLVERATGRAAGNRDVSSNTLWEGHGHGGRSTVGTKSTNLGDEIDHSLGAWAYGSMRSGPTGSHPSDDMIDAANTTWTGRIFAPCLTAGTTASQELVRHPVRLPLMRSISAYAHSSGDLNFAALVYKDDSKNGNIQVTAGMKNADGSSSGTTQSVSTTGSSDGLYLLQIGGLDAAGSVDGEVEQMLSVSLAYTSNSAPGSVIYGTCLWLEP